MGKKIKVMEENGSGGERYISSSGKAFKLRLLLIVTCRDLGTECFRSEKYRGKGSGIW